MVSVWNGKCGKPCSFASLCLRKEASASSARFSCWPISEREIPCASPATPASMLVSSNWIFILNYRPLPPPYETGFGSVKSGEGLGDVIVPGETFLVQQGPQQAQAAGTIAQASTHIAQPARRAVRRVAVEVDQGQAERAHAGSLAPGAHPHEAVEHGDQYGGGAHDEHHWFGGGERAAQKMEDCQKESAGDQDHAAVEGRGADPMHGSRNGSVAIDDGLHGGRQLARRQRSGLQEFERWLYLVGRAGTAGHARGSAGHRLGFRVRRTFGEPIERDQFAGRPILEKHGLAR